MKKVGGDNYICPPIPPRIYVLAWKKFRKDGCNFRSLRKKREKNEKQKVKKVREENGRKREREKITLNCTGKYTFVEHHF